MKNFWFFLLVYFFAGSARAQTDTSFWFVAPDISAQMGQSPVVLHITTYDQASVVYIRQPALVSPAPVNVSVTIAAFSVYTLNLTPYVNNGALESAPVNSVSSKGLYISSKEKISVYYTFNSFTNREMVSLKGQVALGTDFYATIPNSSAVLTHTVTDGGMGIDLVATQPGTTIVLISPKAACVGRAKNVTFAKILTQGQTFSLLDTNTILPSELAGTIISSDKKIAVTVKGSMRTGTSICPSYFTDQITPSNRLGTEYVVHRGNGTEDITFIVSPVNATSFTVSTTTGSFVSLVNSSESFSISNTAPLTFIRTSNPVYVFHFSGFGCKMSGTQLAPAFCAGSYSTSFVRLSGDSMFLNLTVRNGYQSNFNLTSGTSSVSLPASAFTLVPGTNSVLAAARIFLSPTVSLPGSYNFISNSADLFGMSIINGGTSSGSAYASASEFRSTSFVQANSAPTATICANTQFTLNGSVGGGPIAGQWSLINGFGTLSGGTSQLTNNVYTPSALDTLNNNILNSLNNRYVKIVLRTTGVCPSITDTLRLQVKQPPIVSAGSNSVICGNLKTVGLFGSVFGATNQGIWNFLSPASGSFSSGTQPLTPIYQFSQNDTTQTSLQFVLTSTNNGLCAAESKTVTVFINKPPIVNAGPASTVICSNNSTLVLNGVVSGTASSTGVWQTNGGGVFLPNNLSLNSSYIPGGLDLFVPSFWLYLQSTNNGLCMPTRDSMQVFVTEPAFVNAGADINTCSNDARALLGGVLTGTTVGQSSWLGGTGNYAPSSSVLTPTYLPTPAEVAAGFITLTLTTINNGYCNATQDVMRINFQPKPLANFSVNAVCYGEESTFSDKSLNLATTGLITDWAYNFGDGSSISTDANPRHIYKSAGSHTVELVIKNNFNCYDTITKISTVNAIPTSSFEVQRDCEGADQAITFKDFSSISAPDAIPETGYYWDFGGFGFALAKDTTIVFPSDGIYTITHLVNSDKSCQGVSSKTVEVSPKPVARFIYLNNATPGFGANISFRDTSSNATKWTWSFGNGDVSSVRNPVVDYKDNGTYTVQLKVADIYSCTSTFSLEIRVSNIVNEIVKLIPNMISPNDDGKNDFWRLDFIDVYFPKAEVNIYNRWGEQLFTSIGYNNAWNGSYKGEALPVGAYFYTIQLNDGETPLIKGSITLIK